MPWTCTQESHPGSGAPTSQGAAATPTHDPERMTSHRRVSTAPHGDRGLLRHRIAALLPVIYYEALNLNLTRASADALQSSAAASGWQGGDAPGWVPQGAVGGVLAAGRGCRGPASPYAGTAGAGKRCSVGAAPAASPPQPLQQQPGPVWARGLALAGARTAVELQPEHTRAAAELALAAGPDPVPDPVRSRPRTLHRPTSATSACATSTDDISYWHKVVCSCGFTS